MDVKQFHREGWALGLRANKLRDYIVDRTLSAVPEPPAEEEVVEEAPKAAKKKTKKKTKKKAS